MVVLDEDVSVDELLRDQEQDSLVEQIETEEEIEDQDHTVIVLQDLITIVQEKREDHLVIDHNHHQQKENSQVLLIEDHVMLEEVVMVDHHPIGEREDTQIDHQDLAKEDSQILIEDQDLQDLKDHLRKIL